MNDEATDNNKSRLRVDAPVFLPQQHHIASYGNESKTTAKASQQRASRRSRSKHRNTHNCKSKAKNASHEAETIRATNSCQKNSQKKARKKKKEKMKINGIDGGQQRGNTHHFLPSRTIVHQHYDINVAQGCEESFVVPPSCISQPNIPLVGSWAKPLSSAVLDPSKPSLDDGEQNSSHGFSNGLVVLNKKEAKEVAAPENNPVKAQTFVNEVATVVYNRGPTDTSKLMARLWKAVELHDKRTRKKELLRKAVEEKKVLKQHLASKKNEESSRLTNVQLRQSCQDAAVSYSTGSLCDFVKQGSLQGLIRSLKAKEHSIDELNEAIRLSIRLDMPNELRILCNRLAGHDAAGRKINKTSSTFDSNSTTTPTPLLYAVSEQRNACLQSLLSAFTAGILTSAKDEDGNSALHLCCQMGSNETFLVIVNFISSQRNAQSNLLRYLSDRNTLQQTPIHMICAGGHTEILDSLLTARATSSISLLLKLMVLQDVHGQTPLLAAVQGGFGDIVMSLLMWRGNNSLPSRQEKIPSALTWAVQASNKSMVMLLLEFNSSESLHGYNLEEALGACVEMRKEDDVDDERLEILAALIADGANPFQATKKDPSALDAAFIRKDALCIKWMLESYDARIRLLREGRRRDPKLKLQPESFFQGLIDNEENEKSVATRSSLVYALFRCWNAVSEEDAYAHASCAIVLYELGTKPGQACIQCLRQSMMKKNLLCKDMSRWEKQPKVLAASYNRLIGRAGNRLNQSDLLSFWTLQMSSLPWFRRTSNGSQIRCAWATSSIAMNFLLDPDAILVSKNNNQFDVHSMILEPCEKLGAALRFVNSSVSNSKMEVHIGLNDEDLILLLEHLYHGSMLSIDSKDRIATFSKLMDLMLISEEYLCVSLLQECEMRLLADKDTFDRCFCCFCLAKPDKIDSSDTMSRCKYEVSGPSALINDNNVVDLLAVLSQLRIDHMDYCLDVLELHTIRKGSKRPLEQLREQALVHVISNFGNVTRSEAWKHHVEGNDATDIEASFLRLCLDDLSDSLADESCQQSSIAGATRKSTE